MFTREQFEQAAAAFRAVIAKCVEDIGLTIKLGQACLQLGVRNVESLRVGLGVGRDLIGRLAACEECQAVLDRRLSELEDRLKPSLGHR